MIKVHVHILNRRPGEVVKEGDKDYATFKFWAERGDRRNGAVICSFEAVKELAPDENPAPAGNVVPAKEDKRKKG